MKSALLRPQRDRLVNGLSRYLRQALALEPFLHLRGIGVRQRPRRRSNVTRFRRLSKRKVGFDDSYALQFVEGESVHKLGGLSQR